MENKEFNGNEVSGQNKSVLKSGTWKDARKAVKKESQNIEEKIINPKKEKTGNEVVIDSDAPADIKKLAKEKLVREMETDNDKIFAEAVIGYLVERCEEDLKLARDVVQKHKTWEKCLNYIYEQAHKQAINNRACVCDNVVYEWVGSYYHKDDKSEEEKKAKEMAENQKKKDRPIQNKNRDNIYGQLNMFSMIDM